MRKISKENILCLVLLICLLSLTACNGTQETAQYPDKSIEFVVPWSAGGGSDRFGRAITDSIKNLELLPEPVVVVNKPGASGIIGASYVAKKPDDQYTLVTNVTGDIGSWLTSDSGGITIENFTPIAMLAWDEYVLMVKADSPFNSLKDLVDYSKENPGKVTFAGAGVGTVEHMLHETLVKETGAQVEYVPFEGGGEIMSAVLGGHITANWANPAEAATQIEAGTLKALAVASEDRLEVLPDVPTAYEQGYNIVFKQYRGVLGPQNMTEEHAKILAEVLKGVSESESFKEYAKNNSLTIEYKALGEFAKEMDKVQATVNEIFNK